MSGDWQRVGLPVIHHHPLLLLRHTEREGVIEEEEEEGRERRRGRKEGVIKARLSDYFDFKGIKEEVREEEEELKEKQRKEGELSGGRMRRRRRGKGGGEREEHTFIYSALSSPCDKELLNLKVKKIRQQTKSRETRRNYSYSQILICSLNGRRRRREP